MNTTINNAQNVNIYNNATVPSKVCSQCHQNKLLTDYNKDKRKSDGLRCNCKSCQSNTNKLYRDKNQNVNKQINSNKIYDENEVKICSKCKQSKSITEYNKDRTKSNGLLASCKSCQSIVSKHYNDNNKQINANKIYNDNDVKICSNCKQQKLYT